MSICVGGTAHANWLIDETLRHVSAHGRLECLECHADVAQAGRHPRPERVDRTAGDSFDPERCTGCHRSVADDLEKGEHGGRPADTASDYIRCIACHDPHRQMRSSDAGTFDPARPAPAQCGNCHEPQRRLPAPSRDDDTCLACHSRYDLKSPAGVRASRTLCLACHGREDDSLRTGVVGRVPVVDLGHDGLKPHQAVACLTCHPYSAQYGHSGRATADCRQCHVRHPEATAHDAHLSVACEACHLSEVLPVKDRQTGAVRWARQSGQPSRVHAMALLKGEDACRRCHRSPNAVGAAAAVLPPKGILCLPCHAATFSAGDATTLSALIVFGIGLAGSLAYWFSGPKAETHGGRSTHGAGRAAAALRALFFDGLLQRAFYRQSPGRWLVHALIVWPFLLRFLWGIVAWAGSRWTPAAAWPWVMLDKNGWAHALFFDLTGLVVVAAVAVAILHGRSQGAAAGLPGMPRHDRVSSGLLGAVVLVGFVLEGVRIAMTGFPPGSGFAFVGDAISRFFHRSSGLEDIYGWVWYAHAVLTGLFVAWLPFGRMFHIVLAPVLLVLNAWESHAAPRQMPRGSS